jgi:hypothetical protein
MQSNPAKADVYEQITTVLFRQSKRARANTRCPDTRYLLR